MSPTLNQRSPVAKAGWLIGVFLMGWLAFLFIPWPGRVRPPDPLPKMVVKPPSKLQAAGLPDNPDFAGLPEFFSIWADHAEWQDNRTTFAYWHPGAQDFAYYFEAVRVPGGFHFRQIPEPKADDEHYLEEKLTEASPIRFYRTYPLIQGSSPIVAKPGKDNH